LQNKLIDRHDSLSQFPGSKACLKNPVENFGGTAFQGECDPQDLGDGRVAGTFFDVTDINWMYFGDFSELFLGPFASVTDGPDVSTQLLQVFIIHVERLQVGG
jgi:hypothetical protein